MNTAEYVGEQIAQLKNSGIPLSEAAWKAALLCVEWPYIFGAAGQECTIAYRKQVSGRGTEAKYQNVKKACQAIRDNNPTGSCSGCKWYPGGKRVRSFDCRGFTRWILKQVFNWTLEGAGCTSQWNNEANWRQKGTVAEGIPRDVIVCLFYYKKGTKTVEHTGFYYNGETCECSKGVQHSKTLDPKWEMWGVPACVGGDVPTPVPPDPENKPTIRKGDSGAYVIELQTDLVKLGYNIGTYGPGKNGVDGKFGQKTQDAVKAFQNSHDGPDGRALIVDGVVGKNTWWALDQAVGPQPEPEPETYTVTIPKISKEEAEEICGKWSGATMKKD